MGGTKIAWTNKTWNPVTGCSPVSEDCQNCYAEKMARRLQAMGRPKYRDDFAVRCHPECLDEPLRWRQPARVFVGSMADLFHPDVSDEFVDEVFAVAALCPHLTMQFLTKRANRMCGLLTDINSRVLAWNTAWIKYVGPHGGPTHDEVERWCKAHGITRAERERRMDGVSDSAHRWWLRGTCANTIGDSYMMPPNVYLGVTVENQQAVDERIMLLLDTPAAGRWLSCEPLLECLHLDDDHRSYLAPLKRSAANAPVIQPGIDWCVIGAETGPRRRPCRMEWVHNLIEQCDRAHVPIFVKQLDVNGKVSKDPAEWPAWARRREFPETRGSHRKAMEVEGE